MTFNSSNIIFKCFFLHLLVDVNMKKAPGQELLLEHMPLKMPCGDFLYTNTFSVFHFACILFQSVLSPALFDPYFVAVCFLLVFVSALLRYFALYRHQLSISGTAKSMRPCAPAQYKQNRHPLVRTSLYSTCSGQKTTQGTFNVVPTHSPQKRMTIPHKFYSRDQLIRDDRSWKVTV